MHRNMSFFSRCWFEYNVHTKIHYKQILRIAFWGCKTMNETTGVESFSIGRTSIKKKHFESNMPSLES
jgi:hypothetical protein